MSRVTVVGAGYVGLTTAACLSHLGHEVTCADVDADLVARLGKGEVGILEDRLPELVEAGLAGGGLSFVVGAAAAARTSEFVILCVPTPRGSDGSADLTFVEEVAREIGPFLPPGAVVINKSTVPVGSTQEIRHLLVTAGASVDEFAVASNPEFLREGHAVRDFLEPDRIVIGCDDPAVAVRVSALYDGIKAPTIVTDPASAEMIKYASNSFLATKVSFVNAIANLCEAYDADVREVVLGMGYDHRIGFEFLHPGPGFGGSCFPKDTAALLHAAESAGYDFSLLRGVVDVNDRQCERIVAKVRDQAGGDLEGKVVALWGLTFKANTNDVRDSPALAIARRLLAEGALVRGFDPVSGEAAAQELSELEIAPDHLEACRDAQVLAVLTEWEEFRWVDFDEVRDSMARPHVVDARNLLDPVAMRRRGFSYVGVGR